MDQQRMQNYVASLMRSTWTRILQHRDNRLRHGLYSLLLLTEILAVMGLTFVVTSTLVYCICWLLPNQELFLDSIESNACDYAFLFAFLWCFSVCMVVVVETCFAAVSIMQKGEREAAVSMSSTKKMQRREESTASKNVSANSAASKNSDDPAER